MATPTKDEIERTKGLVEKILATTYSRSGFIRLVSHALADTRERETERCAGVAEDCKPKNPQSDWTKYAITCANMADQIAAAIRKGT